MSDGLNEIFKNKDRYNMPTVKTHPLSEIIACRLFSIETAPKVEQRKMVIRCVKSARQYHDDRMKEKDERIMKLEKLVKAVVYNPYLSEHVLERVDGIDWNELRGELLKE